MIRPHAGPRWRLYLRLGRVSNLPTVWTNTLAGIVLGGGEPFTMEGGFLLIAFSLFYCGGMFLNDAFDRDWDRRFRPERPIPAGEIRAGEVFAEGFALLIAGEALLLAASWWSSGVLEEATLVLGGILAALIVYYNWRHKTDPFSPAVMALCRGVIYLLGGAVAGSLWIEDLWASAGVLCAYLVGLTYAAKQEHTDRLAGAWPLLFLFAPFVYALPIITYLSLFTVIYVAAILWVIYALSLFLSRKEPNIPGAVVALIAGISLVDACLMGTVQASSLWGVLALVGFGLTLILQRFIRGT